MEPELALALSTRDWTDHLHRFLADHGGARVRVNAIGPDDLLAESFHVLLIDDICSFLTPRLVSLLKQSGRKVIGVYDPDEFADGKLRLLEAGVNAVVASSADPDFFLRVIRGETDGLSWSVQPVAVADGTNVATRADDAVIAVGGPPGGTGSTELAVAIAVRMAEGKEQVALLDLDHQSPAVAQRLGLPLHPNLMTALDLLDQEAGGVRQVLHGVGRPGFWVLPGLGQGAGWAEIRPHAVVELVRSLTGQFDRVILNLGPAVSQEPHARADRNGAVGAGLIEVADRLVAVGSATPVGLTRLIDWLAVVEPRLGRSADVVLNQAPRDSKRRTELVSELVRSYRPASLATLPYDPEVANAAWDGKPVSRGRFKRAVDAWIEETFGSNHG